MAWSLFGSGVTPKSWADAVLNYAHWPRTIANEQSLIAQAVIEGGGGTYNPLNTTLAAPGSTCFNNICVRNYSSWQTGVGATVRTIQGGYPMMLSGLRGGLGYANASNDLHIWSSGTPTGGYGSLAGGWTRAAGYLGGKSAPLPKGGSGGGGNVQTTSFTSSILGAIIGALGLGSNLKDFFIRGGLIILGGLLLIAGLIMVSKKDGETNVNIAGVAPAGKSAGTAAEGETAVAPEAAAVAV